MTSGDAIAVAARIGEIFDGLGISYAVGGSIASSIAGEPRGTIGVDIVAALEPSTIEPVLVAVRPQFYVAEEGFRRAVAQRGTAHLIHLETNVKVDVFVAGGTALDVQQLNRRVAVTAPDGQPFYVYTPEDILLQKLRWYRKGGSVSDRQWRDIVGIIRTRGDQLDRTYLFVNAPVLQVEQELARALSEAG